MNRKELSKLAMFSDGSGNSLEHEDRELEYMKEHFDKLNAMKAFYIKNRGIFAQMDWRFNIISENIEIHVCRVCKPVKYSTPEEIAMAFPDLTWTREQDKYFKEQIDWKAVTDCVVELVIERAEIVNIPKAPKIRKSIVAL